MSSPNTLRGWFQFSDRDKPPYNPTVETSITTDQLMINEVNEFHSARWRREEWFFASALVPEDQLHDVATIVKSPQELIFSVGWNSEDQFDFGDFLQKSEFEIYPLTMIFEHPISHEITVEPCRQFIYYHALQKKNSSQYFHPLDNILVAEAIIETHKLYNPTAKMTIHRDYLRDFLAATGLGLIISVVADRFANAPTEAELELDIIEGQQIDEFTWLSTNIHTPKFTGHDNFRGRSILNHNYIIEPYEQPKYDRTPWYFFGKNTRQETEYPTFIVNNEGERKTLPKDTYIGNYVQNGIGTIGYLYFKPEVLQKYLQVSGYSVFFHMRNWGVVSLPGERGSIDVGINSHGLVNAFAPDIAKLTPDEQAYWASFSSLPSGEICEEMFQTRMQSAPPHSPGTVELIQEARSKLITVFESSFSVELFNNYEPSQQELCKLSVGPIRNQFEIAELAKILYGWIIETMQIDHLRRAINILGEQADKNLRQIKLMEKILILKGFDSKQARSMTAPLVGLNELRISSAHIGEFALELSFGLLGATSIPSVPRDGWFLCVDAVTNCLNSVANSL